MLELEPASLSPVADRPRHAHQEIVDLLTTALLRLRGHSSSPGSLPVANRDEVALAFGGQKRVNANPDHDNGVRP